MKPHPEGPFVALNLLPPEERSRVVARLRARGKWHDRRPPASSPMLRCGHPPEAVRTARGAWNSQRNQRDDVEYCGVCSGELRLVVDSAAEGRGVLDGLAEQGATASE